MSLNTSHVDSRPTQKISLEAFASELRHRREAIAGVQGCHTYLWQDIRLFEHFADERGLWLKCAPCELASRPDFEGNEHQVWFDSLNAEFLKVTWPGFFGLKVVYSADEDPLCSPIDYLWRWVLHNRHFGDRV
jgi:hypothetical protein